jgi:hypothetical protein
VGVPNLFTGILFDANDGERVHLCFQNSSKKEHAHVLVSYGSRCGKEGSAWRPFPYQPVENMFLSFILRLTPVALLGDAEPEDDDPLNEVEDELRQLERKIAGVQKKIMDNPDIDALLDTMAKLGRRKKELGEQLDAMKADANHQQPQVLSEAKSLVELLEKAGGKKAELRTRLKSHIRALVTEAWLHVWDANHHIRVLDLEVALTAGGKGAFRLAWIRRGKGRGMVLPLGGVPEGEEAPPLALKEFCSDKGVRKAYAALLEAQRQGVVRAVEFFAEHPEEWQQRC